MATFDLESLTAPVSPDEPGGVDLDLAGDSEYMNFVAGAEGRLPSSYFDGKDESGAVGRPFQFTKVELDAVYASAAPLLAKTRDLRLLVLLAKFAMLGRQLDDFITLIRAVATLLAERWDDVHPRAEDGAFQARLVAVESIDSQPTVIMPLQFFTLIEHRRFGAISYRGYLTATGASPPRENEEIVDLGAIDKLMREVELPLLVARRGEFTDLQATLDAIRQAWSEKDDSGVMVQFDKIVELVGKIVAFLDGAVAQRDPSAALSPPAADGGDGATAESGTDGSVAAGPAGRVTTRAEAAAALTGVADYFSRSEPSSPTLLLVLQANQLLGKSFLEVMNILVPDFVDHAAIDIGRTETFSLPITRLSSLMGEDAEANAAEEETEYASEDEGEAESEADAESEAGAESEAESEPETETDAESESQTEDEGGEAELNAPSEGAKPKTGGKSAGAPQIVIGSRNQALSMLDQTAAYLRAAEPSSPIPFLIERARDLAQRDFLSVLKALLPDDTLKSQQPANRTQDDSN